MAQVAKRKLVNGTMEVFYICATSGCKNETTGFFCDECRKGLKIN